MTWLHGRRWRMLIFILALILWIASFQLAVQIASHYFYVGLYDNLLTIKLGSDSNLAWIDRPIVFQYDPTPVDPIPDRFSLSAGYYSGRISFTAFVPTILLPPAAFLLLLLPVRRRPIRDNHLRCPACHHNLAPPGHLLCPECGWHHDGTPRSFPADAAPIPPATIEPHPTARDSTN